MMKTKQSVRRTYVKPGTETVAMPAVGVLDYTSFRGNANNEYGNDSYTTTPGDGGGSPGSADFGGSFDSPSPANPAKGFSGGLDDVWD